MLPATSFPDSPSNRTLVTCWVWTILVSTKGLDSHISAPSVSPLVRLSKKFQFPSRLGAAFGKQVSTAERSKALRRFAHFSHLHDLTFKHQAATRVPDVIHDLSPCRLSGKLTLNLPQRRGLQKPCRVDGRCPRTTQQDESCFLRVNMPPFVSQGRGKSSFSHSRLLSSAKRF